MFVCSHRGWAEEKEVHDKLRKGGFDLWLGPDGAGQFIVANMRNGGGSMNPNHIPPDR